MLAFYATETEYVVWGDVLAGVGKVAHVFAGAPFEKQLHAQILKYVGPKAFEIGWEKKSGEAHEMGLLRGTMLYAAGHYGDHAVVKEAQIRFAAREKTPIAADLRSVVYRLVAENGGEAEYNAFLGMYHEAPTSEEKNRVGMALGYFKQAKLLKKTLALALSKDVRPQDAPRTISWVAGSTYGNALAWEFMQKNWKELHRRYSLGGHMLPHLIAPLAACTDKQYAKEIVSFFKKNAAPGAARTITQIEEKILLSDAWKKRDMKKLAAWIRDVQ
jgi:aminopeptidase 2